MPHTPESTPAEKSKKIDALRQQLTDADRKRREILTALFLQHTGELDALVETLISAASPETLNCVETMLAKGGES
ncbi:MAG: hypothetical protein MUE42_05660 [Opitutaceae bacterium]|jgi:hypothetical protein|nr:hypothetical protein [Opitutaceae bacterium]